VARRAAPAALVVTAALANLAGVHGLASLVLLAAVPACAWSALASFGDLLEARDPGAAQRLQALLMAVATPLVVLAGAARPAAPGLATSALLGCLALTCLEALVGAGAEAGLQRERVGRVATDVDQRLDEDERPDGDDRAERDRRAQQPLRRRRAA
jgi:hypothetical protein